MEIIQKIVITEKPHPIAGRRRISFSGNFNVLSRPIGEGRNEFWIPGIDIRIVLNNREDAENQEIFKNSINFYFHSFFNQGSKNPMAALIRDMSKKGFVTEFDAITKKEFSKGDFHRKSPVDFVFNPKRPIPDNFQIASKKEIEELEMVA